jgi:hypothetical protein
MSLSPTSILRRLSERLRAQPWWVLLCWGALWAVLAMMVWASRRGFDFTDEGYYYMSGRYWKDYANIFTQFAGFMRAALNICGGEIWRVRLLTVALTLLSTWVLWRGVVAWIRPRFAVPGVWLPVLLLWSLMGFVWLPVAISYNTLNGMAAVTWTGVWLMYSARLRSGGGTRWTLVLALFGLALLAAAAKPTTGACLLAVSFVALIPSTMMGGRLWRAAARVIIAGSVAAIALCVGLALAHSATTSSVTQETAADAVAPKGFLSQLVTLLTSGQLMSLALLTGRSVLGLLATVGAAGVMPFGIALMARWAGRQGRAERQDWQWAGAVAGVLGVTICLIAKAAASEELLYMFTGASRLVPALLVIAGTLFLLEAKTTFMTQLWRWMKEHTRAALDGLVLVSVPFWGWLGAHNSLEVNTLFQLTPWVLLVLIGAERAAARASLPLPRALVPLLLQGLALVFLWSGVVAQPYRQVKPLYELTKEVKVGPDRSVLLMDSKSGSLINQTRAILKKADFKTHDPILAFYDVPGLAFAVGGRSPGMATYSGWVGVHEGTGIVMAERNAEALMKIELSDLKRSIIFQTPNSEAFSAALSSRGIHFPGDYELLGTVPLPPQRGEGELKIWKPRSPHVP